MHTDTIMITVKARETLTQTLTAGIPADWPLPGSDDGTVLLKSVYLITDPSLDAFISYDPLTRTINFDGSYLSSEIAG